MLLTDAPVASRADNPLAREGVVLSTAEIQKLIPHRWPMLMVDRIVEYDPSRGYIRGEKAVTGRLTVWMVGEPLK